MESSTLISNINSKGELYSNSKDNVKVVIRVRPLNEREKSNGGHKKCVNVENETGIAIEGYKPFNFDYVADEEVQQSVIFDQIAKPITDCCLEGYNGSIFAYGQTGSGKTFTIQGPNQLINGEETIFGSRHKEKIQPENSRGIMQRSFEYIFECLENDKMKAVSSQEPYQFEYLIRCSYLEIYNEQIMDLLEPSSINLHIREDIKKGVYVEGLQEEVVLSSDDMIYLIQIGAKNRHVGSHALNKESSRSHSVLTTIIESKSMKEGGVWNIKTSRFHIIDLAGSERSKQTNAVGDRLKEAGMINKSLSALGNVINSLVDISEGKSRHVHYRDSKLTFLLRDSLGGNSKTLIIANITPSNACHGETLSTLKFAQRAKLIKNKAIINEDSSGTITLLKGEISLLKKELAENEKIMKSLQTGFGLVSECTRCKAMFEGIEDEEEGFRDEDEMLLSFDNDQKQAVDNSKLKKKLQTHQKNEIIQLRARVTHLESLLSANLDSLSGQQKYYEGEVQKWQLQSKRIQQTVESYEKQSARDKMIIKFREERILKLEAVGVLDNDQKIADLKKEVQMWKEAADHNTQAAKLFAEKSDLQNKLEQLKSEYKQTPESLAVQMRSLTELNESLNQYLKSYCEESKKEIQQELEQIKVDLVNSQEQATTKINELNSVVHELESKLVFQQALFHQKSLNYKEQLSNIEIEFGRERSELERINIEAINVIKQEINEQISLTNSDNFQQSQLLQMQILEKQQLVEKEREQRHNSERQLLSKLNEIEATAQEHFIKVRHLEVENERFGEKITGAMTQIENERLRHLEVLQVVEERWDQKVKDLDDQLLRQSNEKDCLTEQCEQATDTIQILREETLNTQKDLFIKEELLQEFSSTIQLKDVSLAQLQKANQHVEQALESMKSKNKLNEIQQQQIFTESHQILEQQLQQVQSRLDSSLNEKNSIQQEFYQLEKDYSCLKNQLTTMIKESKANENKTEMTIAEKQKEVEIMMEEYVSELAKERSQFNLQIESAVRAFEQLKEQQLNEQKQSFTTYNEEIQVYQNLISELQSKIRSLDQSKAVLIRNHQCMSEIQQQEVAKQQETYYNEVKYLNSKIKELEYNFNLNKNYDQVAILQNQVSALNCQMTKQDQDLFTNAQCQEQKLNQLQLMKEQEIAQMREDYQRIISTIQIHVDRLQAERIQSDDEMSRLLDEERSEFKEQVQFLTLSYENKLGDIIKSKELNENLSKSKFDEILKQKKDLTEKLQSSQDQQRQQVEISKCQNNEIQQQLNLKQSELLQHNQHLVKVSSALTESQMKLQTYHLETSRLATQLDQSLSQNDQVLLELEGKLIEIESLRTKLQEVSEEVQIKDSEYNQLREDLEMKEQVRDQEVMCHYEQIFAESEEQRQILQGQIEINLKQESASKLLIQELRQQAHIQEECNLSLSVQLVKSQELLKQQTNDEFSKKLSDQQIKHQDLISKMSIEMSSKEQQIKDLSSQQQKLKKRNHEQDEMLKQSKDTISLMMHKDVDLQKDLKERFSEIQEREERYKRQLGEVKEERERVKKEGDNMKELVRLKDKQIEDYLNSDERDRQALLRISKENKDVRNTLTKREFEMKELVKTLKFFTDEKGRLEKEIDKLHIENDQLIGHKNPSQKIQHHVKIKEENNRLREDNLRLHDELKRKIDIIAKNTSTKYSPDEFESINQRSVEQVSQVELAASRLVDHLLSQPNLSKAICISEEFEHQFQQQTATAKIKKSMEIVSQLNECFSFNEGRIRDLEREVTKYQSYLHILEKERVTSQQLIQGANKVVSKENNQLQGSILRSRVPTDVLRSNTLQINSDPVRINSGLMPSGIIKKEAPKLVAHQVRGGSTKRMINGAAAAFINVGPQISIQQK